MRKTNLIAWLGLLLPAILPTGGVAQETMLYVSTTGNDAWSGRVPQPNGARTDGPFATLAKARDAVRALRKPATVRIRAGTYALTEPLIFTPRDSGTPRSPVIYEAAPGETVVLSGGRRITGWKPVARLPGVAWTATSSCSSRSPTRPWTPSSPPGTPSATTTAPAPGRWCDITRPTSRSGPGRGRATG